MMSSMSYYPCPLISGPNTITNTYSLPQITDNYPISEILTFEGKDGATFITLRHLLVVWGNFDVIK